MPAGQWILLNVPTLVVGLLLLLLSAAVAIVGLLIVRHYFPPGKLKAHHDIAGPIFATIGVIYAVLLAFVCIVVYEQFDRASRNLVGEANIYGDIYRTSIGFPEPFRGEFRTAFNEFVDAIMEDEWRSESYVSTSPRVLAAAKKVNGNFAAFEPANDKQLLIYAQVLDKLQTAGELRRQRILDEKEGLPLVLWVVLIVGALITVSFTFFFGSDNRIAHYIMTTMVSLLIALVLFTILVMDVPFTGDLRVETEPLIKMVVAGRY